MYIQQRTSSQIYIYIKSHKSIRQLHFFRCANGRSFTKEELIRTSPVSLVVQSYSTLSDPMDCSMPGFPVNHQLQQLAQTHVHRFCDAIQPSHPLSSPSPPVFNLSKHQGPFQSVSSSQQVAKVLELQLQHQSFE